MRTYAELTTRYPAPRLKRPFNLDARRATGISETELQALETAGPEVLPDLRE